jgi:hypothetical protein
LPALSGSARRASCFDWSGAEKKLAAVHYSPAGAPVHLRRAAVTKLVELARTAVGAGRPLASYARVQAAVSLFIRDKKLFFAKLPPSPFYIDIGCGSNISDGYYNFDYSWRPGIHRCLDLAKSGLALPPQSVRGAFTEHCLEHLSFGVCAEILSRLHAAMVDGAWLRIIVPDGELYCRTYIASLDSGINSVPFGTSIDRYQITSGQVLRTPIMSLNAVMRDHGHQFIYDFGTLAEMLRRVGFRNIQKLGYKFGNDPMLLKDTERRSCESLYVECQK